MRRPVAAALLSLIALTALTALTALPAAAGDKLTMHVSATILPRNTCALGADAALQCSGTDAKVLYRASSAGAASQVVVGNAPRGRVHKVRTARGADLVTIEF